MKRGGFCFRRATSASITSVLAANWRATAAAASCASACIFVVWAAIIGSSWSSVCGKPEKDPGSRRDRVESPVRASFGLQFGDEVVGIAAIERAGVLHDPTVLEEGAAFDEQPRAAFGEIHQPRLFGV